MPVIPANTEVKIYTANFIDSSSTITSNYSGTTANLYDKDVNNYFETVGSTRDVDKNFQLDITFKIGSTETEMTLNSLILINHNWRDFDFYIYENSAYRKVFSVTENQLSHKLYHMGAEKTSRIRIIVSKTILPNREKKIGELIICRLRYYMKENPISVEALYREKKRTFELGDGSRVQSHTRFSTYRCAKWGARISFTMLPVGDISILESIKNEATPFLIQPEANSRPDQIYYVNWVNQFTYKYTMINKNIGFDTTMELEEV